jgi:hypothetical protein
LLSDAQKVLTAVQDFLLTEVPENARCSNDEIIRQISIYVDVFTVFDSVFSNSRSAVGKLSESKGEETRKAIALGLKMWRDLELNVSPKLHILEGRRNKKSHCTGFGNVAGFRAKRVTQTTYFGGPFIYAVIDLQRSCRL